MKRISLILVIAASIFAVALPSSAQTVPILSGTIRTVNVSTGGYITGLQSSTFLTPLGTVSIGSNGFNGTLTNTILPPDAASSSSAPITSSILGTPTPDVRRTTPPSMFVRWLNNDNFFVFTGTTNGTSPNGAFTNAPTTINADLPISGRLPTFALRITGGSIKLPTPPPPVVVVPPPVTCTDCLIVRPDLRIANSIFLSPDSQEPEYRQEYKNDFSASSFRGGRILGLEDK